MGDFFKIAMGKAAVEIANKFRESFDKSPEDQVSEILAQRPISMKGNRQITKQYRKRAGATPDECR
jgi:hypothetical protein